MTSLISQRPWLWPALLVGVCLLAHAAMVMGVPSPYIFPDELIYLELSRHLAHGDGFGFRGHPMAFPTVLYPLLAAPAQWLGDPFRALKAAQLLSSLFMSLAAWPIYGLARQLMPARWALAAAALAMVAPYVIYGHVVMTEGLFMLLVMTVAYTTVRAIADPAPRWKWFLGLALGLTFFARPQGMLLAPVVLATFGVVEVFRRGEPPGWLRRMAAFWPAVLVFVGFVSLHLVRMATAAHGQHLLSPATYLGTYAGGLTGTTPFTWAHFLVAVGGIAGAVGLGVGFWPLVLFPSFVKRAWHDGSTASRAFAAFALLAGALLVGLAAQNVALLDPLQVQERYCIYVAPWLIVGAIAALHAGVRPRGAALVAGAALIALSAAFVERAPHNIVDSPSYQALYRPMLSLGGPGTAVVVAIASLAYMAVLAVMWRRGRARWALGLAIAYGCVFTGFAYYAQSTLSHVYALRLPFVAWVAANADPRYPLVLVSDGLPYLEGTLVDVFAPAPIRQVYLEKPFAAWLEGRLTPTATGELPTLGALPDGARILTGPDVALELPVLARRGDVTIYEKRGAVRLKRGG